MKNVMHLTAFPYMGCKRWIADIVWQHLGRVEHYIEPFCGSAAVLLARPDWHPGDIETINDADGLIVNFWRSLKLRPEELFKAASYPIIELDLVAWNNKLRAIKDTLTEDMKADPEYCVPEIAGRWLWAQHLWYGVLATRHAELQVPRMMTGFQHMVETHPPEDDRLCPVRIARQIAYRIHDVRVLCGDFARLLRESMLVREAGPVGVFLDPPYPQEGRTRQYYYADDGEAFWRALHWCEEHTDDQGLRIAIAGFDEYLERLEAKGWSIFRWKGNGGYANKGKLERSANSAREAVAFSPSCAQPRLFSHDELFPS